MPVNEMPCAKSKLMPDPAKLVPSRYMPHTVFLFVSETSKTWN